MPSDLLRLVVALLAGGVGFLLASVLDNKGRLSERRVEQLESLPAELGTPVPSVVIAIIIHALSVFLPFSDWEERKAQKIYEKEQRRHIGQH